MADLDKGWIKTTCAYCGVGCGVEARPLSSGQLEIRGDKSHPANYGKLCTKGVALGKTVTTEGRLLKPTIRTQGVEQEVDWQTATSLVAKKLLATIDAYGPESVAFYVSGQLLTEDYYVANKLMKGFIGGSNIDSNSRLCMASAVAGHKRAFGADVVPVCYEDLECSDMVVIVGSNLAWCHPVLFQRLRTAKQSNPDMKVVVIDPRKTDTCEIADSHLSIHSGSDVALFNGLLCHLLESNAIDSDFIDKHTQGFESALLCAQKECSIEKATGLTSQEIQTFYTHFSRTEKVVTIYSQGVNQSTQGTDKVNSIINCHLATGKIGKAGSGPFSVTGQPNAMGGREVGALANMLAAHMDFNNAHHQKVVGDYWRTNNLASKSGLKAVDMFEAINDGKIKAIWIMATNPVVSLPDNESVIKALEKCPFVVVSDCIKETDTTQFADVLLPAQGWSEKSGTVTNSERRISRQRRLLPSPGLAKPDWWIVAQVAQQMGFAKAFDYLHEGEIFKEYVGLTAMGQEQSPRALNLSGLASLDETKYTQLLPQQWPVLHYQLDITQKRLFKDHRFFTSSTKAQFIAVSHKSPASSFSTTFSLELNTGRVRDHWHTMTRTGLSTSLASHTPEPFVLIHPSTADHYRLYQGALAKVSSKKGSIIGRVKITPSMTENQIFMPIHWSNANSNAGKPCELIESSVDPISGQPEFKSTAVSIKRFEHKAVALALCRRKLHTLNVDYWCRQAIENGYLYRIASGLSSEGLVAQLSLNLQLISSGVVKHLEVRKENEWQQANLAKQSCDSLILVKENAVEFSQRDIELSIEQFNRQLDEEGGFGLFSQKEQPIEL